MGGRLAFGESFTWMYDEIWLVSLMEDDLALKEVAHCRAILVGVDANDATQESQEQGCGSEERGS